MVIPRQLELLVSVVFIMGLSFSFIGCGKKGPPKTPRREEPPAVTDLSHRIEGDTQALELNQIKLSAGDKSETLVGAEGRVHFGDWDQPDPIESMDLAVRMSGRDTGFVSALAKQELPALAYQSQARVHTVDGQHRVDDYKLVTPKGEPLDVWEKGSADKVTFLPAFSMEGIWLDHRARTDDVAKLNTLFKLDRKIPALGRLDMRAIITGTDRKLLINELELSAGDEDVLRVRANGALNLAWVHRLSRSLNSMSEFPKDALPTSCDRKADC